MRSLGFSLVVLLVSSWAGRTAADDPGARIVARVGKRVVTVADMEGRLSGIPAFQLATFGGTPDQIRRKFLDDVMLPELWLAQAAEDRGLDHELPTENLLLRVRSNATLRQLRKDVPDASRVTTEEIGRYYDAHKDLYDTPERVQVYRVLLPTREAALEILARMKKEPSVKVFGDIAREKSLDKATSMRRGDLGFLSPDGTSSEAGLAVDPAVITAARAVKDGELVPDPVPEGPNFGVVWRRGTVPANKRALADVEAQIRDTLYRERVERATRDHIADLRRAGLKDLDPDPIKLLEIKIDDGTLGPRRKGLTDAKPP